MDTLYIAKESWKLLDQNLMSTFSSYEFGDFFKNDISRHVMLLLVFKFPVSVEP